jgi:Tfp pilus assembly protein PilN
MRLLVKYIVYALTRQAALAHGVQVVPQAEVEQQQQAFQFLIKQLGQASSAEIESVLAAREQTEPETDLRVDIIARLKEKIQAGMDRSDQS